MPSTQKRYFLIANAEADTRSLVKEAILTAHPNSLIVEAVNGNEAFQKAARQQMDVIILDNKVPGKTALQLVESFENLPEDFIPKSMLIFASEFRPEEEEIFSEKKIPTLKKPCTVEELSGKISDIIKEVQKYDLAGEAKTPKPNINVEFVNPFIQATIVVLETTASTKATKEKIFIRSNDMISGDISAIIAMNTDKIQGSMAISFEKKCFLSIASKMLGENYTEITPDISDAAGELCNQIFGMSKRKLNESGYNIQPALPSVVVGPNHKIKHMLHAPIIAIKFATEIGSFTVECSVVTI